MWVGGKEVLLSHFLYICIDVYMYDIYMHTRIEINMYTAWVGGKEVLLRRYL